ncbi:MAG: DNA primase, partial [Pseudoalteromonas tetraodonis]
MSKLIPNTPSARGRQMIPEEKIQEVLQATDIVALVESYFPLKRAGTDFRARCPFHNEKTPSFNVNPARQIFKCFGCGVGGNAIAFVRDYEGLTFPEAVKRLCEIQGIEFTEQEQDAKALAKQRARSKLMSLHKKATEWYHERLIKAPDASGARNYLKGRGLNGEIAARWGIGYAPADGAGFLAWAKSEGFGSEILMQSGMAALRDEKFPARGLYARFRDRVMFPIANDVGDVIAFSGRILDPESKLAKYMNSPESPLFLKSKVFFGFDKSKRPIIKAEKAIVCEGQLDLITCFEFGIENVLAPLGTAMTKDHARMLARYAKEVIMANDSDSAGYKATERAFVHLAHEKGVVVRVVDMPPG